MSCKSNVIQGNPKHFLNIGNGSSTDVIRACDLIHGTENGQAIVLVLISTSWPKVDDNNIIILFMTLNLSLYLS
jgi:hypothetical protein